MATDSPPQEGLVITMVLKTEPDIKPFFLNFWFNPGFLPFLGGFYLTGLASGSRLNRPVRFLKKWS